MEINIKLTDVYEWNVFARNDSKDENVFIGVLECNDEYEFHYTDERGVQVILDDATNSDEALANIVEYLNTTVVH